MLQLHYSNMETACKSLNSKLEKLSKEQSECTIYRVHRHLRNVNRSAYEPEVIAIGPYHHGKDHLKMMENHKLRNLQSLVERRGLKADTYAIAVSDVESEARKCYADQDFSLNESKFIEMLVLDGCFIIELVRKFDDGCLGEEDDDPIFNMGWMIISLKRDLMLFENQVPFFVLCILFDYIKCHGEKRNLLDLLTNFFSSLYPGKVHRGKHFLGSDHEIKHLLDLIHRDCVFLRSLQLNSSPKKKDKEFKKFQHLLDLILRNWVLRWPILLYSISPNKKDKRFKKSHPPHMMCSMPVQERKENEVVPGSMPVQDKKEIEVVMGSMPVQERKGKEIAMIGGMPWPVQETKETEVMVDMIDETEVEILGSGMPIQDTKDASREVVTMGSVPLMPVQEMDEIEMDEIDILSQSIEVDTMGSVPGQERKENEDMRFINCATELTKANVEFKKKEKVTLFDIDFKDGVMGMPPLIIEDGTECFLRNLIVYEQYFRHQLQHTVVTDYMKLLDSLINSAKDVEILSRKYIITNWQGDDEVVANMVNRLGDLVTCGGSNFSYATLFEDVNKHCERPWNRWMAKLRRDYLNSPWAIISILVAVVLLLLTVTQTSLSVLQVVQEN